MCRWQMGPVSNGCCALELCKKRETNLHNCGFGVVFFEFRLAKVMRFVNSYFCTGELASSIDIWRYEVSNVGCKNGGSE